MTAPLPISVRPSASTRNNRTRITTAATPITARAITTAPSPKTGRGYPDSTRNSWRPITTAASPIITRAITTALLPSTVRPIQLHPKSVKADHNRGIAYGDKGDYVRAIADYDEAIRLDPKAAEAHLGRGHAYSTRRLCPAPSPISKRPSASTRNSGSLCNRGNAYFRKGDYDRAIADYGEAIRLNPQDAVGLLHPRLRLCQQRRL